MSLNQTASESERILYRVLQRANLAQYYDTFVQQGGDDVGQLCEAGEEEFLEIMALVGMALKPLHVRRLQKVLQEYVSSPALFHNPFGGSSTPPPQLARGSIASVMAQPITTTTTSANQFNNNNIISNNISNSNVTPTPIVITPTSSNSLLGNWNININKPPEDPDSQSCSPIPTTIENEVAFLDITPIWKAPGLLNGNDKSLLSGLDLSITGSISPTPSGSSGHEGSISSNGGAGIPQLNDTQMRSIEAAAAAIISDLPVYDMKPLNMKKDYNKELMQLITMPDDTPDKMTLVRKYSAIYNRFDSKRKNEGRMTLHEVSVNEAAAQLCRRIPALLTRRDDLYPLSRRVVRDSGYQYSKGHSRAYSSIDMFINNKRSLQAASGEGPPSKRATPDDTSRDQQTNGEFNLESAHQARISQIHSALAELLIKQEDLKTKIKAARETENWPLLESYRSQLERCSSKQLQLRMEQSSIIGSSSSKTISKSPTLAAEISKALRASMSKTTNGSKSNMAASPDSSNGHMKQRTLKQKQTIIKTSPASLLKSSTSTNMPGGGAQGCGGGADNNNTSLLVERVRLAQQYGMSQLADELINSIAVEASDSDVDEQEEWNREVEKDMIKQNLSSPLRGQGQGQGDVCERGDNGAGAGGDTVTIVTKTKSS